MNNRQRTCFSFGGSIGCILDCQVEITANAVL